jgi:hypothetical protein
MKDIVIPAKIFSKISILPKADAALYLYIFYSDQKKLQSPDHLYATVPFCTAQLGWARTKVISARGDLRKIGLIEDYRLFIGGKTYVRLNSGE